MFATEIDSYRKINMNMPAGGSSRLGIKKILLAEDDDDDFNLFNSAISYLSNSIEVLRTKNGIMLSSLIQTAIRPDLIILDINMPFKSGILSLQEIKKNPRLDSIKVIMFSTSGNIKDIDNCYTNGADFYLIKPMTYKAIIKQFEELFSNECFLSNTRPPRHKFVIG